MIKGKTKIAIESYCSHIDPMILKAFFARMDPVYFTLFPPEEIARHIQISSVLDSQKPAQCEIHPKGKGTFDIVVVAFDFISEFSILCGLLVSFGFDIQSGNIFTFSDHVGFPLDRGNPGRMKIDLRKKIIDVFHVRLREKNQWNRVTETQFRKELLELILLLKQNDIQEARSRMNRRVIEHLSKNPENFINRLYPVKVKIHNGLSKNWTVMEIHGKDTPAFLYSLSNALSMRGALIQKVVIENVGSDVQDWIYFTDMRGKKIEGKREQNLFKVAAVMIKQFTHFLIQAPDPSNALRFFDQMLDKIFEEKSPKSALVFLKNQNNLSLLARFLGASDFLWEEFLRMHFKSLFPVLEGFQQGELLKEKILMARECDHSLLHVRSFPEKKKRLNAYKDREMFRIDMKHFLDPPEDIKKFSQAITQLAEVILEKALSICGSYLKKIYGVPILKNGRYCSFALFGLGKLGGQEMGYASDIELLFVYEGDGKTSGKETIENQIYFDRLVQKILQLVETKREGIFRIDLRLRPFGSAGPLSCPFALLQNYYIFEGEAAPFERQALIKLRFIGGNKRLGKQVEALRDNFVYSNQPWDLNEALRLRNLQMKELVQAGAINVKYSSGGVIDVEYAVQYFQVMQGHAFPQLRTPSTLGALDGLYQTKLISKKDRDQLRKAYLFLRFLIDGLRMVRGHSQDLVLPERDSDEFKFLARRLGYQEPDWKKGARILSLEIQHHMSIAQTFFEGCFEEG